MYKENEIKAKQLAKKQGLVFGKLRRPEMAVGAHYVLVDENNSGTEFVDITDVLFFLEAPEDDKKAPPPVGFLNQYTLIGGKPLAECTGKEVAEELAALRECGQP